MNGSDLPVRWRDAFLDALQDAQIRDPLREAALAERLKEWTTLLTGVVASTCRSLGWAAAAKGHKSDLLPQAGQEYLGIDVMAFESAPAAPDAGPCWRWPLATFELENSRDDDRVAYSLWKVACVRARMGVVFAYRRDLDAAHQLVSHLSTAIPLSDGPAAGSLMLVLGMRDQGEGFPWGYFRFWSYSPGTRKFERM